ncbi:hypothetical protein BM86_25195 [Bacillus thuringiensis]|uniref:Uncharacterized protein n=1 Tax=Bacillus thuringiensis TaxID=1428 RepID=A0A9W3X2G2_BACTU|nr:hypothetical protein [Bacillus thuringiensis]ANS50192.1 hypothetical protein BT246_48560 [Bacillus thuringiensis]MBH0338682.1 hypothetical protein [Bacillus thuringiensis]
MNIKQYGKREKRLVEQVGMTRMWDFNQLVITSVDTYGIGVTEAMLEDLQQHAIDTANLHIQAIESEKAL